MPNKTYVPGTVVDSDSLNAFNLVAYNVLGNGVSPPANAAAARTNLGLSALATQTTTLTVAQGGTGATTAQDAFTGLSAGTGFSFRNLLINSGFAVNQRQYVSGTATVANNQFTVDRWKVVVSGQNLIHPNTNTWGIVTAPAGGLEQVIEGNTIEGGIYTLSWVGTATATVNGTAIVNGAQTASLTTGANVTVRFSGGTVSKPQFERNLFATRWEFRSYAQELILCQRYCIRFNYNTAGLPIAAGVFFSSVGVQAVQSLPVFMRVAPTVSASTTTWSGLSGAGTVNLGIVTLSPVNENQIAWLFTATATGVAGDGVLVRAPSSQWVMCEAEL